MTKRVSDKSKVKALEAKVTELESKLKTLENTHGYTSGSLKAAQEELNNVHAFFDGIKGVLPKKNELTYGSHSAVTRLASWLAVLSKQRSNF